MFTMFTVSYTHCRGHIPDNLVFRKNEERHDEDTGTQSTVYCIMAEIATK